MKQFLYVTAIHLLACIVVKAQPAAKEVSGIILQKDSLFWLTYNTCDLANMGQYFTDDAEFYHDKGGITLTSSKLVESVKNGLCASKDFHLRREAVKGTVHVFPMMKNDTVYAAIISGDHYFYITQGQQKEYRSGLASFTHLWMYKDGVWKMSRLLSYDHREAPYVNERKAIKLPVTTLQQFTGKYKMAPDGIVTAKIEKEMLVLTIGNNKYLLYPETQTRFFLKERDLVFEFEKEGNKVTKLRVYEKGNIVDLMPKL